MIARITMAETRAELTKFARLPAYVIPTIAFPLGFYAFFGLVMNGHQSIGATSVAGYMLATFGAFGVVGCALFGFAVSVAVERGQGWLLVKRASPMPMAAYFVSKLLTTMLFALIVVLLMSALASEFGGVRLAPAQWLALVAALVVGSIPFAALGLAMGFIAGPNSAPAIVNVIYLPLSFLSGLWIPVEALPPVIAHIAPFLPTYHLGQLALGTIGSGHGSALTHIAILVLWTIAGVAAAAYGMKRDEGRTYG
ncbi:MAG TPA: ABC transporter permease [Candidatus Elarobacter sp.]|jgi:ABC-2 type transport system permease protein|nr:ABC transporter permease [Candidatus Elarobacter sp.]